MNGVVRAVDPRPQPHGRRRAAGAQARARSRRPRPLPGLPRASPSARVTRLGTGRECAGAAGGGSRGREAGGVAAAALCAGRRAPPPPPGCSGPAPPPCGPAPPTLAGGSRGCRLPSWTWRSNPAGKAREAGARSRGACRGRGGLGGATPRPPRPRASRARVGARRRGGGWAAVRRGVRASAFLAPAASPSFPWGPWGRRLL